MHPSTLEQRLTHRALIYTPETPWLGSSLPAFKPPLKPPVLVSATSHRYECVGKLIMSGAFRESHLYRNTGQAHFQCHNAYSDEYMTQQAAKSKPTISISQDTRQRVPYYLRGWRRRTHCQVPTGRLQLRRRREQGRACRNSIRLQQGKWRC